MWWRWYYWASPIAWTIYGLLTSQLGDRPDHIVIPERINLIQVKDYFKEFLGFDYDFLGAVAAAHVAWVLIFFFVFVYAIRVLNFQRR